MKNSARNERELEMINFFHKSTKTTISLKKNEFIYKVYSSYNGIPVMPLSVFP